MVDELLAQIWKPKQKQENKAVSLHLIVSPKMFAGVKFYHFRLFSYPIMQVIEKSVTRQA
ncbi:hypothetical protein CUMW_177880 [Citrus unshiu]|nr:hypothetical protein CUMW_177880 [Citrus unshiu]